MMLKITLISCGRLKEKYLKDAVLEYKKRLSSYVLLEEKELDDGPDMESEARRIIKAVPAGAYVITLEIEGRELTSGQFAQSLDDLMTGGISHVCFIIGGSEGLLKEIKDMSRFHLSFSRMTFPHQLMRVIFLEQLYRAFKIIKGEPYHK